MTDHVFGPDLCKRHIGPEVTEGPDAALIRLCRVYVEIETDYRDLCAWNDEGAAEDVIAFCAEE